jgi:hypothetical protein
MSKIHFPFYFWEKKSTKIVPEYNILKLLKENSEKFPEHFGTKVVVVCSIFNYDNVIIFIFYKK